MPHTFCPAPAAAPDGAAEAGAPAVGELDAPPEGAAPDCSEEPDDDGELDGAGDAPPEPPELLASPGDDAPAPESAGEPAPVEEDGDADPVLVAPSEPAPPPVDPPDEDWLDEGWSEESGGCWSGEDTSTFGGAPPDCGDTVIGPIRTGPT